MAKKQESPQGQSWYAIQNRDVTDFDNGTVEVMIYDEISAFGITAKSFVDDLSTITETYAAKSGRSKEEMLAMMSEETWLTADEAVEAGLADSIQDGREEEMPKMTSASIAQVFNRIPKPLRGQFASQRISNTYK